MDVQVFLDGDPVAITYEDVDCVTTDAHWVTIEGPDTTYFPARRVDEIRILGDD